MFGWVFFNEDAFMWAHLFISFTKFYSPTVFKERGRREVNSQTKRKVKRSESFCKNSLLTT